MFLFAVLLFLPWLVVRVVVAVVPAWVLLVEDFLLRIGYRLLIVAHEVDTAVE